MEWFWSGTRKARVGGGDADGGRDRHPPAARGPRKPPSRSPGLSWECLERRSLLSNSGYDYALSGFRWSDPSHITYSIAADGVDWVRGVNALNATFNAEFGDGVWQRAIARALATWESVANINITG